MIAVFRFLAVLTLALLIVTPAFGVAFRHETYSSVKYLDVIEKPVGTELNLQIRGGDVHATLKDFEGSDGAVEVQLRGKLVRKNKIVLAGASHRGKVEVTGTLERAVFRGTIKRWFGEQQHEQQVVLRRKVRI
jgi:hypothetical protein